MDEKIIEAIDEAIGGSEKYGHGVLARLIIKTLEGAGYAVTPMEPKCVSCGAYIHHGPILCDGCRPKWQPIETVPEDGTRIDLWAESHRRYTGRRFPGCSWNDITERWTGLPYDYKEWKPVYWMFPPDPPKDKDEPEANLGTAFSSL